MIFNVLKRIFLHKKTKSGESYSNSDISVSLIPSPRHLPWAFILCLLCLFVYISPVWAEDKPYKATTVDECIHEEVCVWYAFSHGKSKLDRTMFNSWKKNIVLALLGVNENNAQDAQLLIKNLTLIEPHFSQRITIDSEYNTFIVFTDDIKRAIYKDYNIAFTRLFGKGFIERTYETTKNIVPGCYGGIFKGNAGEYLGGGFIIDTTSSDFNYCLKTVPFRIVGLSGRIKDFSFSQMGTSNGHQVSNIEPTKLDYFLLDIMYHSDMNQIVHSPVAVFSKVYKEVLYNYDKAN